MLKSHACDAMTGAAGDYAGWCEEAKGGNGVRRLGACAVGKLTTIYSGRRSFFTTTYGV